MLLCLFFLQGPQNVGKGGARSGARREMRCPSHMKRGQMSTKTLCPKHFRDFKTCLFKVPALKIAANPAGFIRFP